MTKIKDIRTFQGGMNLDDEKRIIPKGDYGMAYNFRSATSEEDNVGSLESIKGNLLIDYDFNYPWDNTVIGSANDYEENRIIYLIHNPLGLHCILAFNLDDKSITTILKEKSVLNFQLNHRIYHAQILGGILFWTDNYDTGFEVEEYNPPRSLNLLKAQRYTETYESSWRFTFKTSEHGKLKVQGAEGHTFSRGDRVYIVGHGVTTVSDAPDTRTLIFNLNYSDYNGSLVSRVFFYDIYKNEQYYEITEQLLERIKYPPIGFDEENNKLFYAEYFTDEDYGKNNLFGRLFQFRVRWVYDDSGKSRWSHVSNLPLPESNEFYDGETLERYVDNAIKLHYPTGPPEVKRIEIALRETNTGYWKLIKIVEKYNADGDELVLSNINTTYNFYNDVYGDMLDQIVVNTPFDYIPQISATQEIIEKNRIVDGNYVEGYDNVKVDVDLFLDKKVETLPSENIHILNVYRYEGCDIVGYWGYRVLIRTSDVYPNTLYKVIIKRMDGSVDEFSHQAIESDTPQSIAEAFWEEINGLYYMGGVDVAPNNGRYITICPNPSFNIYINNVEAKAYEYSIKNKGFKSGAYCEFGIVYYDRANRSGAVNYSDDCKIYIPFYGEDETVANTRVEGNIFYNIKWEINHLPPKWATHYQWVYSLNTKLNHFFQFYAEDIGITADDNVYIDVNTPIETYNSAFKKSVDVFSEYVYEEGDRIRIIARKEGNNYIYLSEYLDFLITGQTETGGNVLVDYFNFDDYGLDDGLLYEIYSPVGQLSDETSRIFWEFSEIFPIENPNTDSRVHGKGKDDGSGYAQIQTEYQSAKGIFMQGDVYFRGRPTSKFASKVIPVESSHYSDYYVSNSISIGRVNGINLDAKRQRFNYLRHGGRFLPETNINEIAKFDYDDYEEIPQKYGFIYGILETRDVLKIFCSNKIVSIYIGKAGLRQAQLQDEQLDIVAASSKVLGTWYPSVSNYGTTMPASIVCSQHYVYCVDFNKGNILRIASNGIIPISNHKVRDWVRDTCNYLKENYLEVEIISGYDQRHSDLYFSFIGMNSAREREYTVTILFNEENSRWCSFVDFKKGNVGPDHYAFKDNVMVSFMEGEIYLHNENTLHCNFYGMQYYPSITIITNENPLKVKTFNSISLDVNKSPETAVLTIPVESIYPHGMYSELASADFVNKEGIFYAPFKRDMYTSSNLPPALPTKNIMDLINGRALRGKIMSILVTFNSNADVILFSSIITATPSERSGV